MSNMGYMPTPEPGVDIVRIVRALTRSLRWMIPLVLLVSVSAMVVTSMMTPRYRAESQVLIETQMSPLNVQRNAELERAQLDQQGIQSQVQVLSSRNLAQNVITRLNLEENAEFGGQTNRIMSLISSLLSGTAATQSKDERVMDAYFKRLRVFDVKDSRVIVVQFWSYDPVLAAEVANTLMAEYKALQAQAKRELNFTATVNLEPEILKLKQEVEQAERAVAEYRAGQDLLVGVNDTTLSQQQLSEINTQLTAARARQSEAEAQADLIRSILQSGGSLETAPEVLNSPLFQRLRERQVALQSQVAELSATFLNTHPRIQAIRSQLADIDRQVRNEARNILDGIENESRIAAARVASLVEDLNEMKAAAAQANEAQVQLSSLERESDVKATQLSTLLRQFSEAQTQRSVDELPADARVISRAVVPSKPHSPKVLAATIIAGFATALLSMMAVIIRELLTTPTLDPQMIATAAPQSEVLAEVNELSQAPQNSTDPIPMRRPPRRPEPMPAAHIDPTGNGYQPTSTGRLDGAGVTSPVAQATVGSIGEIWARIHSSRTHAQCLLVLALDDESLADATVVALARQAAASRSTIAIDLRTAAAAAHYMIDGEQQPGFWDLLEERSDFSDIIFRDTVSNAHVIGAGRSVEAMDTFEPEIGAEQMDAVFDALDESYDCIIANAGRAEDVETAIVSAADQIILVADRPVTDLDLGEYHAVLVKLAEGPVHVMSLSAVNQAAAVA